MLEVAAPAHPGCYAHPFSMCSVYLNGLQVLTWFILAVGFPPQIACFRPGFILLLGIPSQSLGCRY